MLNAPGVLPGWLSQPLGAVPWPSPQVSRWLYAAWLVYILALAVWIVLQRRSPVSTLAWVMSLAALPVIGFAVYYLFGPVKVRRRVMRRMRSRATLGGKEGRARGSTHDAPPAVTDPVAVRVQQLGEKLTEIPLMSCTSAQLLIDGAATYDALLEAIGQATHHIHLEYYIFEPQGIGERVMAAMAERARAGVTVRLLVDAVGSSALKSRYLKDLLDAGAQVHWFHPFRFAVLKPMLNLRTHRKIAVIDGRIGFTGGINITDNQDERVSDHAFRDLHLRFEGRAVHGLQTVFIEDWVYAKGSRPQMDGLYPDAPDGPIALQWLPSGPDTPWEPVHRTMLQAIGDAKKRVWLVTPYFVPTEPALVELQSAALRGLDVRLVVPRRADSRLVTWAARSYYEDMTGAGAQVYEFAPRMLHTKALLVDDAVAIVGSANFDQRSFRLNFELCAALFGERPCQALAEVMEADMAGARPVPKRRTLHFGQRLAESTARLFSPVL